MWVFYANTMWFLIALALTRGLNIVHGMGAYYAILILSQCSPKTLSCLNSSPVGTEEIINSRVILCGFGDTKLNTTWTCIQGPCPSNQKMTPQGQQL